LKVYEEKKINEIFREINRELKTDITVYMLGGGALIRHGFKVATKDIDLVTDNHHQIEQLTDVLKDLGYVIVTDLEREYLDLGANVILEREDSPRFDIFFKIVCKKLMLSKDIKDRAIEYIVLSNLNVKILSKEDIFLFKVVATRERDMEDASLVVESDVDWYTILEETEKQNKYSERKWFPMLYQAIEELETKYHQRCPVKDEIYSRALKDLESKA